MTVSSQTNKVIYIGNGIAKEFAIPFLFLEQRDVKVTQKLNDIQTERTDWTVENGNIVFKAAPESGAEIAIVREVPLTQETDYRDNEILHAETLERNFDKLTMQVQQLKEQLDRAVTVDVFDDTQAASLIPSIRKAVSDCAEAVKTAKALKAETNDLLSAATRQANDAAVSAANAALSETNTAAMLETKADADLANCSKPYVTETYRNGADWYRLWSDGWLEQGGSVVSNSSAVVFNFFKPFTDTDYSLLCSQNSGGLGEQSNGMVISKRTESTFGILFTQGSTGLTYTWQAKGKAV